MIMAWLAGHGPEPDDSEAQAKLKRLRKHVAGAHFCQSNSRNLEDGFVMAPTLDWPAV